MNRLFTIIITFFVLAGTGCTKSSKNESNQFPPDFNSRTDESRVEYVMKNASPDSVARFICNGALGKLPGAKIENLGIATNYAYENYKGDDLDAFSNSYDTYVNTMALADKMKIYALAGTEDPQGLGLTLGLEYMQSIRENSLTPEDVEKELREFKKACKDDPETYKRFLIGFKTVLKADQGKDVPVRIYERFINYE